MCSSVRAGVLCCSVVHAVWRGVWVAFCLLHSIVTRFCCSRSYYPLVHPMSHESEISNKQVYYYRIHMPYYAGITVSNVSVTPTYPIICSTTDLVLPLLYSHPSSSSLPLITTPNSLLLPTKYQTALPQHVNTPTQLHVGSLNPINNSVCTVARGYPTTFIVSGVVAYPHVSKAPRFFIPFPSFLLGLETLTRRRRNPVTKVAHAAVPAPSIISQKNATSRK